MNQESSKKPFTEHLKDLGKTPKPKKESDLSFKTFSDKEINSTIQKNQDYQDITDTKEETVRFLKYLDQFENRVLKNRVNAAGKEVYNGHNKRQYDGYQTIAKGNGKYAYEPFYKSKTSHKVQNIMPQEKNLNSIENTLPQIGIESFSNPESIARTMTNLHWPKKIFEKILSSKEITQIIAEKRLYNAEVDEAQYRDQLIEINRKEIEKIDARLARFDSYRSLLNAIPAQEENQLDEEPIQAELVQEQDSTPTIDIEYQDVLGDKKETPLETIENSTPVVEEKLAEIQETQIEEEKIDETPSITAVETPDQNSRTIAMELKTRELQLLSERVKKSIENNVSNIEDFNFQTVSLQQGGLVTLNRFIYSPQISDNQEHIQYKNYKNVKEYFDHRRDKPGYAYETKDNYATVVASLGKDLSSQRPGNIFDIYLKFKNGFDASPLLYEVYSLFSKIQPANELTHEENIRIRKEILYLIEPFLVLENKVENKTQNALSSLKKEFEDFINKQNQEKNENNK